MKALYYISTGLLSLLMLFSAGMYFFNHEAIAERFTNLGYPTYIIYPFAVAKILGLIAIWTRKVDWLKEWAYAGFFFDVVLAASAHLMIDDGAHWMAIFGLVMVVLSYYSQKQIFASA